MRLFDLVEAQHFCTPISAYKPGLGQSLVAFHRGRPRSSPLSEGSADFEIHRTSLLNFVERWILFGVANYRRALDMFVASNAPWAQVTLYYSSFYAANAILGMFGVWISQEFLVDVSNGKANGQVLHVSRNIKSPTGVKGSHRVFWDFFYEGHTIISPWMPTKLKEATEAVSGDRTWQINARNNVNYDMAGAYDSAVQFSRSFDVRHWRDIPGPLGQQLDVSEAMLRLALYFVGELKVRSFAFEGLGSGPRERVFRELVSKAAPSLVNKSLFRELIF